MWPERSFRTSPKTVLEHGEGSWRMIDTNLLSEKFCYVENVDDIVRDIRKQQDCIYSYDDEMFKKKGNFFDKSGLCRRTVNGVIFSCLFIKGIGDSLSVAFTGARMPDHNYIANPRISRWSYYKLLDGCLLGFDDPMYYKYPGLNLGWYYGDRERFYINDMLSIIDDVIQMNRLDRNKVTFFSSSGGGYAALMASMMYPASISISLNPQIFIHNWSYFPEFSRITGIRPSMADKFHRFNPVQLLNSSQSRHLVCFNIESDEDVETQLKPLVKALGMKVRYGLNSYDNLLIWLYDAAGAPMAHTAFETKAIFCAMNYIAQRFKMDVNFDVDEYQPLSLLVNELWRDLYAEKKRCLILADEMESKERQMILETRNIIEKLKGIGVRVD